MKMLLLLSLLIIVNQIKAQEPYTPESEELIIATWKVEKSTTNVEDEIVKLLSDAKYPGNSHFYAQAAILLEKYQKEVEQKPQFLYYKAITKQYYHKFKESADLLETLLKQQANHENARLLLSNMYAVQGQFTKAKALCTKLLGSADMLVIAACKLNIDAQQGNHLQIQTALTALSNFSFSRVPSNIETAIYIDEIRASMATYINDYSLANKILSKHLGDQAPVSFWVLWADVQLALDQPSSVLSTLGFVVSKTDNQDDALLLRLALAEKALNIAKPKWLPHVKERIALRELRRDDEHAFDIALYYLHLQGNAKVALKWAELNWQQAKFKEDALLLTEINIMLGQSEWQSTPISSRGDGQ